MRKNKHGAFGKTRNARKGCHKFGPFLLTSEQLKQVVPASFECPDCLQSVRCLKHVIPGQVARMITYVCPCGTVIVWEDEHQPEDSSHWQQNIELLRASGKDVRIFNGNKPLQPDFSGLS
jgi:hypothetical protein